MGFVQSVCYAFLFFPVAAILWLGSRSVTASVCVQFMLCFVSVMFLIRDWVVLFRRLLAPFSSEVRFSTGGGSRSVVFFYLFLFYFLNSVCVSSRYVFGEILSISVLLRFRRGSLCYLLGDWYCEDGGAAGLFLAPMRILTW
jgi:hypothetical protein